MRKIREECAGNAVRNGLRRMKNGPVATCPHACYNESASGEFVTILTIIKTTEEIEK